MDCKLFLFTSCHGEETWLSNNLENFDSCEKKILWLSFVRLYFGSQHETVLLRQRFSKKKKKKQRLSGRSSNAVFGDWFPMNFLFLMVTQL